MGSGKIALGKTMIGIGIGLCVLSFFLIVLSVSAWFWLTGIGGCILIGTGLHVKDDGEWEVQKAREIEEALWDKQYNDPKWRKNNPYKASVVEQNRAKEHQRQYGPAVEITSISAGHMDSYNGSWYSCANSAGGWSVLCNIRNIGARVIKYVDITFAAYNAVNDKCYCSIKQITDIGCRFTGPLDIHSYNNQKKGIYYENLWYNISLARVSVEHIHVDFMDGTSQDIYKNGTVKNHGF